MSKVSTPWGEAVIYFRLNPDKKFLRVNTDQSGGIGIHPSVPIPAHIERCAVIAEDGWRWFEDDQCAAVVVAFPELFSHTAVSACRDHLRHTDPETFTAHFGITLTAADSRALEQREFEANTRDNFIPTAGFGDWAWNVPKDSVYVCGWRQRDEAIAGFLVPAERFYEEACRLVLDEFPRWEPDRALPYYKPKPEALAA